MPYLASAELPADFPPLAAVRARLGFVPSIFPAQGLLPRAIEAEASMLGALLLAPGAIPWVRKEEILVAAASAQRNLYCVAVHARVLGGLGCPDGEIEAIVGGRFEALGPERSELLAFAVRLATRPATIVPEHLEKMRAVPLGDEEILEAVQTAALTRFLCTLSAGIAPPMDADEEPRAALRTAFDSSRPPAEGVEAGTAGAAKGPWLRAEALTAESFPPFAIVKQAFGFVPGVFRAQGLARGPLEAEIEAMRGILLAEDVLSRTRKELVLLAVASAGLDVYSAALHTELLRGLGVSPETSDAVAAGREEPGLPPADAALLRFAEKLACHPGDYGARDVGALREVGFADREILEAIVTTAFGAFLGTLGAGLGPRPDFRAPREALEERRRASAAPPPVDDPDRPLVDAARGGDPAAFEALLRRHQAPVYRTLAGLTGSAEDAEDGCQAVFLRAFHKLDDFAGASRFSTWLTRIAIREGLDRLRRRHPTESLDAAAEDEDFRPALVDPWVDDPERLYEREEMRRLVRQELARLPVRYRAAVMLRDIEQLSTSEAAAALELPVATLKTRLLRGRLLLREALAAHFSRGDRVV